MKIAFASSFLNIFFYVQLERTFIAIKPDGVQRGLVSLPYTLLFIPPKYVYKFYASG